MGRTSEAKEPACERSETRVKLENGKYNHMIKDWKYKKVAVIGAGIEGIANAEWLVGQGAQVTILDKNKDIKILRDKDIKWILGEKYLDNLTQYDVIVRSPGIKRNLPEIVAAEKAGKIITSQTKIFFELCPAPIIGVTGTKGKGQPQP